LETTNPSLDTTAAVRPRRGEEDLGRIKIKTSFFSIST